MKRLIVSGAVLLGWFSSVVTGCGSRSSDNDYLPGSTAGEDGVAGSSGSITVGAAGAFAAGASAGGFANIAGSSGSGNTGGASVGGSGVGGLTGTAGGATAGAGGSTAAGAGGASTAGAPSAGSSGVTSTGGNSGAAGAGGSDSVSCPTNLPNNNSTCPAAALQCNYTGRSCGCRAVGNNLRWRCTGSGVACPGTEPTAATACMGTLQCPYPDGGQCNCDASGQWRCFTAGCPISKPTPSGPCGSVFGQCTYGTGAGSACVCVAGGWFCN
ncbi:MAG: hypothetical protein ABI488_25620 [Polyangiaceae bacterium]